MAGGRPSLYTPQLRDLICTQLAGGKTLKSICADDAMPAEQTVHRWLKEEDKKEFRESYRAARLIQYDVLAERILDIGEGDPATDTLLRVNRDRLRIFSIQWYLGKLAAKKYGDKPQEEQAVTGEDLSGLSDEELDAYVALRAKIEKND